jgi:alkaline phosphatase
MNKIITILCLLMYTMSVGQTVIYTVANLHSHNDYEKSFPFWEAYNHAYGSIEADIFLQNGNLIIAHNTIQLKMGRTFDSFYLYPLQQCIVKNNNHPYADKNRLLQLLIDVKTDSVATLNRFIEKLKAYPVITACAGIKIVITGNRPAASTFADYPSYIYFDGELDKNYSANATNRIEMLSDNFRKYSWWNGTDTISMKDKNIIMTAINKAHELHKKVRFWNAPDTIISWNFFMKMGVDYINTDHITGAADYIN